MFAIDGGRGDFVVCARGFCESDEDERLCKSMAGPWAPVSLATYCRGRWCGDEFIGSATHGSDRDECRRPIAAGLGEC